MLQDKINCFDIEKCKNGSFGSCWIRIKTTTAVMTSSTDDAADDDDDDGDDDNFFFLFHQIK